MASPSRKEIAGSADPQLMRGAHKRVASHDVEEGAASPPSLDPVVAKVAAWIAEYERREALVREWQDAEAAHIKARQCMRRGAGQTRAMNALDRQIRALRKTLDHEAKRIANMPVESVHGAFAKIKLALQIQGPDDWNDEIVEPLVRDGCKRLEEALLAQDAD
jgi:hypothetical protein